jgi:hypothetical protein
MTLAITTRMVAMVIMPIAIAARSANAAWPNDPNINLPFCTSAGDQKRPEITSDGIGGAIVAWDDFRGGGFAIYAQHIFATGVVDQGWPVNGVQLCAATTNNIRTPSIDTDGHGGALVTWRDYRSGTHWAVFVQHVLASGVVDPAWPANGFPVSATVGDQATPDLVGDGAGGAIVVWSDLRDGVHANVYSQHVRANGTADTGWPVNGALVSLTSASFAPAQFGEVADGSGGAIAFWSDNRGAAYTEIAQHILANGAIDSAWPATGLDYGAANSDGWIPYAISDGAGGALVTWMDTRGPNGYDIYAQHVLASGAADSAWPAGGSGVHLGPRDQVASTIASDGSGGAIVVWQDAGTTYDVYAEHLLSNGAVDAAWPADGLAICTQAGNQLFPQIVSDGAHGAFMTWQDGRNGTNLDVYAQHVLAGGMVDPHWPVDGAPVTTAGGALSFSEVFPVITASNGGGVIVAWPDHRGTDYDLYAQYVGPDGLLGGVTAGVPPIAPLPAGLARLDPNPWQGGPLSVEFSLGASEQTAIELFDTAGRRVAVRDLGTLAPGNHRFTLGEFRGVPGLYLVRVQHGAGTWTGRAVLVR